jgi:hypothetical protein
MKRICRLPRSAALPLVIVFTVSVISAAQAQSTWVAGATNNILWSKLGNWNPLGAPNSNSAIAIFGPPFKANPSVDVIVNVGEIQFVAASPAYTITVNPSQSLSIHGAGTTNQSAFVQTFANNGVINFTRAATAGTNVSITTNETVNVATVNFVDQSSAGNATITTNSGGSLIFKSGATGASAAVITNDLGVTDISQLLGRERLLARLQELVLTF